MTEVSTPPGLPPTGISLPPLPVGANGSPTSQPSRPAPPDFPDPEPLDLSEEDKKNIVDTISELHRQTVEGRDSYATKHQDYDLAFRGQLNLRGPNSGPWPGSSNLHIQMPYWLVDAYNTRLVSAIWGQNPQVVGHPTEDDDEEVARDSANLIQWHLQPRRMDARANWSRMSKTRCIHGRGVGILPWATEDYLYRVTDEVRYEFDEEGDIVTDEEGVPIESADSQSPVLKRETKMDGPLLVPLDWDDIIEPMEGTNLQPIGPSNPLGADWVGIRQWEPLSLIWQKRSTSYPYIDAEKELSERSNWLEEAPSQDRSGSGQGSSQNQKRVKLQDYIEGRDRAQTQRVRSPKARRNPEFEVITWMMPWELPNEDGELEETECIFFYRVSPKALLGAFRLSDLQFRNRRPLVELDFQTVGTRRLSMGIMEVVKDLSAELDTIHNMRMDVGFATNMPFFFYRATSGINPERIVLRPGKGIPVDDVRDIQFPQMQNVTSFYHQEEQLLYSLVERVLGITDLFLGVSPTRGAAARHATGFVGTQQEAMARVGEVVESDAMAFSKFCHLIYEAEIQFGPDDRIIRLQGREGPLSQKLSRKDLWYRGEYDFTLGSNQGMYSQMMRAQQADSLMQIAPTSPLIMQDPGRLWEVMNFWFRAKGFDDPELFIGPKDAVSQGVPKPPDEENGEMDQQIYGVGQPAPVNPSDNDQEHHKVHVEHLADPAYLAQGSPNLEGHQAHLEETRAQMESKSQMMIQGMMQGPGPGQPGMPGMPGPGGGGQPNARNVASLQGVEQQGAGGDVNASPGVEPPPSGPPA